MNKMLKRWIGCGCALVLIATSAARAAVAEERMPPLVASFLNSGRLAEGDEVLAKRLAEQPGDDTTRFSLGVLRFMRAVERLTQSLHRYGLQDRTNGLPLPILRLPLPTNPTPEKFSYENARQIIQTLIDDLARVETTLAAIQTDDLKLPIHFGRIRIDFNGNGQAEEDETLWRLYARLNRNAANVTQADAENFLIVFDKADATWLQGYCHLLSALGEMFLAYDHQQAFERTGHVFFAKVETPHKFLADGQKVFAFGQIDIADLIAFIHLLNFPLRDPPRMKAALTHMETVIALSRRNWREILAETDNDHEWIPSPKQTGVIPGVRVTLQMTTGWSEFLDEAERVLRGEKLIPFWRANDDRGVNLRKVFTEPRPFDLVLWAQGSDATPYLEAGPRTTPDVWTRFNQLFRGQFLGFAIWFN